jgi:argininosuccinate lyase
MLESSTWNIEHIAASIYGDFSTATDLADFLATNGTPFRQAHELVGKIVRSCSERGCTLEGLTAEMLAEIAPEVPAAALSVLQPAESVRRRESYGAPGPNAMKTQIALAKTVFQDPRFSRIA